MKRPKLFALILALTMLAAALVISSCSSGGNDKQTTGTEAAPDKPATVTGWFDYGTALYLRDKFTPGTKQSISFQMAKNEKEGFEYVMVSDGDIDGLRCEVTPLGDGSGHVLDGEVFIAWQIYVRTADLSHKRGYTPEPLLEQDNPYQGGSFDLISGRAKTIYVQYSTDADTVPGTYTGQLEIRRGGETLLSGEVSVTVRDVYYEEKTYCSSMFGYTYCKYDDGFGGPGPDSAPDMDDGHYSKFHGVENDPDKAYEIRRKYVDFMLENRLGPAALPLKDGLLDDIELVRKYMDNPRLTLVNLTNESTLEEQSRVAEENGWLDKISVSYGDEPTDDETFRAIKAWALELSKKARTTKLTCAFGLMFVRDILEMQPMLVERMSEFSTFYCPDVYTAFGHQPTLDFMHKMREERGDTLFWYDAGPAYGDYVNKPHILTCVPGLEKRIIFWQQYMLDIDGFLYYHSAKWNRYLDFWAEGYEDAEHPMAVPGGIDTYEGLGVLMYWDPVTEDPKGSLSLEAVRDGIEDFQLMKMAEAAAGRDAVMELVNRVTTGHSEFTSDPEVLEQAKNALFDIVESGGGK